MWSLRWIIVVDVLLAASLITGPACCVHAPERRVQVPLSHSALSGDVEVHLQGLSSSELKHMQIEILRVEGSSPHLLTTITLQTDNHRVVGNTTSLTIPCGYFYLGGLYLISIVSDDANLTEVGDIDDMKLTGHLDVRWPEASIKLSRESIETYPDSSVSALLEFPDVVCPPITESKSGIPEFWLELVFCGPEIFCSDKGVNDSGITHQVLYSEQVRGFPVRREITLRCELFGQAGHYALHLRPATPATSSPPVAAYVKADWSDQFVFNVHARSIFPCDVHSDGVGVLFQYPSCILDAVDRVRLFAKLRADVSSLAPPTSLHYVTEKKVIRGQHSLHFDCELFSERYIEYCFVYVSQAITGAVADVRMDCVPTLPVAEPGSWGSWSPWTQCSSTCQGGTRNRHRLCNSPKPRYGAKFCEGSSVESESCGIASSDDWQCMYGQDNDLTEEIPADRPEILAEIGPGCRCGCVVYLGAVKSRRLVGTSSQSCPGRTFWLIQAEPGYLVRFNIYRYRFPCTSQWLKIRDGDSLSANMIGHLEDGTTNAPSLMTTNGQHLLLEFFSDEVVALKEDCIGEFLAYAKQIPQSAANATTLVSKATTTSLSSTAIQLTVAHIAAILFVSIILVLSALLGAQYVFKYRKYELAEDLDSLNTSGGSMSSLPLQARAMSNATLLSEVISLTRLRPKGFRMKHSRLTEYIDCENLEVDNDDKEETSDDTPGVEETNIGKDSRGQLDESFASSSQPVSTVYSSSSVHNVASSDSPQSIRRPSIHSLKRKRKSRDSKTKTEYENERDKDTSTPTKFRYPDRRGSRCSNSSNATLTNGCYSPAASMISTATIRTTNPKESKEKRNRERLLAGPSELSLANPDLDMELDYYDYNVVNAGAAPGSYLGMDPAFLIWIPPLSDSDHRNEDNDERDHLYEEIIPRNDCIDPGSNRETPEEEIPALPTSNKIKNDINSPTKMKYNIALSLNTNLGSSQSLAKESNLVMEQNIPLQEFTKEKFILGSPAKVNQKPISEKCLKTITSPTNSHACYIELDDIQFADE